MQPDDKEARQTFDVALSFAGEDRAYVDRVARALRANDIRVFYDEFETVDLWGADLYTYLDDIYRYRAKFAVVFSSDNYARKMWTSHERQSAQARALTQSTPYLLPVRLDDSEIPGIRPTVAFIDGRTKSPEELADLIRAKLTYGVLPKETGVQVPTPFGVPRDLREKHELVSARPKGWEYLLFAGALWQPMIELEPKFRDHELKFGNRSGRNVRDADVPGVISDALHDILRLVDKFMTLMGAFYWAVGDSGAPGDPVRIEHLAGRIMTTYSDVLDWSAELHGLHCSEKYFRLFDFLAQFADPVLAEVRRFVEDLVVKAPQIHEFLIGGDDDDHMNVALKFNLTIGDEIVNQFNAERKRLFGS